MKIRSHGVFPEVLVIAPELHQDERGFFLESFQTQRAREAGLPTEYVQDNHSRSNKGVLRGLHFQRGSFAQGRLVRVSRGVVFDAVVDIRPQSPTFGQWAGLVLSDENHLQLYIPPGFAHGFLTLRDETDFLYKATTAYRPDQEGAIHWQDPALGIDWPLAAHGIEAPVVSAKDQAAPSLSAAQLG